MTLVSKEEAIERIANDNVVGGMKRINEYCDSTEHNDYLDGISTAIATVDDVPSAEAEWIPCSERLPEDGVAVLITTENEEVYIDQVITDPYKERYFQSNTAYDNFQVIAWMPLPKPYREESEVKE